MSLSATALGFRLIEKDQRDFLKNLVDFEDKLLNLRVATDKKPSKNDFKKKFKNVDNEWKQSNMIIHWN